MCTCICNISIFACLKKAAYDKSLQVLTVYVSVYSHLMSIVSQHGLFSVVNDVVYKKDLIASAIYGKHWTMFANNAVGDAK